MSQAPVIIPWNDQYLNQTVNKDERRPGDRYQARCWHETANGSGNPHNTLKWNLKSHDAKGKPILSSYDVLIDRDGEPWRYVDWTKWNSWSEGKSTFVLDGEEMDSTKLGRACIGIELDGANDGKQKATAEQIEMAGMVAVYFEQTLSIPLDGAHDVTHAQIAPGRKTDPRGYNLAQIFAAAQHWKVSNRTNWIGRWGTAGGPYNEQWGIPTAWRKTWEDPRGGLGMAISPEFQTPTGHTAQLFKHGIILWRKDQGTEVLWGAEITV